MSKYWRKKLEKPGRNRQAVMEAHLKVLWIGCIGRSQSVQLIFLASNTGSMSDLGNQQAPGIFRNARPAGQAKLSSVPLI